MDDADTVRVGQTEQRALQDHEGGLGIERAPAGQQGPQRDTVHQLHHDRGAVRTLDVLVQPGDVRALQAAQQARLRPEVAYEAGPGTQ